MHKDYEPSIRARLGTAAHFFEVVVLKLGTVWVQNVEDRKKRALDAPSNAWEATRWSAADDEEGGGVNPAPYTLNPQP